MRIAITGGLGFIGLSLGRVLASAGHAVRLTDVSENVTLPDIEYLSANVLDREACRTTCKDMDFIVHSAAVHDAKQVANDPLLAVEINVQGTLNLLRAAVESGVRRFVYMSSAKVFGEPEVLPSAETDLPIPRDTYALSKYVCEEYCRKFQAQADIDVVIVRPFSVYGPSQVLGHGYIGMIVEAMLNDAEFNLPGRPDFLRDFVHINDMTRLISALIEADLPGVSVLNAGSGRATSLAELVALAENVTGRDLAGQFVEPGRGTMQRMQADMAYANDLLGYQPAYELRDGLAETIDWFFRNQLVAGKAAKR